MVRASFAPLSLQIPAIPAQTTLSSEKSRTVLWIQSICWSLVGTGASGLTSCFASFRQSSVGCCVRMPRRGACGIGPQQQRPPQGSQCQLLPAPSPLLPGITSQMNNLHSSCFTGSAFRECSEDPVAVPRAGCDRCVAQF